MLYNSYPFILVFLPLTLGLYYWLCHYRKTSLAVGLLVVTSCFFYAWWSLKFLFVLMGMTLFNYAAALLIHKYRNERSKRKLIFTFGLTTNLCLLGYFKYTNFFIDTVNALFGLQWPSLAIILPLGISFFTFQKIAYLVDVYRGTQPTRNFLQFALFVSFFPQLIAGPITHHSEMLPQFKKPEVFTFQPRNMAFGLTLFIIGLSKKVLFADNLSHYSLLAFDSASTGTALTFIESWAGALAYTLQIYFDFSGYSDMAIGLGKMFNIEIPMNFSSPYKASNIISFWRRWHMTLSRFLRDYVYIPLGGNHNGDVSRYCNIMLTMLIGGLWHGAGWTFVIWGGLHGTFIVLNHFWHSLKDRLPSAVTKTGFLPAWTFQAGGQLLTFILVTFAWVFFRAQNAQAAWLVIKGMFGLNGIVLPPGYAGIFGQYQGFIEFGLLRNFGGSQEIILLLGLLGIVWFCPNSWQIMQSLEGTDKARAPKATSRRLFFGWQPTSIWAGLLAVLTVLNLIMLSQPSEFLYFQF